MNMNEALDILKSGTEKQLRELEMPWCKTDEELQAIVAALSGREHDYGTCVYAMSLAALSAYYLMSHKMGVTGFQASCADMDFLARTRRMKDGFQILDYNKLLYPQHRHDFDEASWDNLLAKHSKMLREKAITLLAEQQTAHPNVVAHWQRLAVQL